MAQTCCNLCQLLRRTQTCPFNLEIIEIIALSIIISFKLIFMLIAIYQIKKQENYENNNNNPPDTYDMPGTNN